MHASRFHSPLQSTRLGLFIVTVGVMLLLGVGCAKREVTRVDTDTTIDLSGYWNDTDSRLVAETMIGECLEHSWATRHMQDHGGKLPVVIVGAVRNYSTEHIAVATFMADIERALINSGRARVVATSEERQELRLEKVDQWENASPETVKQIGREHGADYMMYGQINTITDQEDGKKVLYYQVDLNLTDIQSNLKVWPGQHKIKKFIGKGKYKP